MRPIIGITCCYEPNGDRYHLARDYVLSVKEGGGIPVILPHYADANVDTVLDNIHGLILSGGGDIDPALFGEEPWPENGNIDPRRDVFELAAAARALQIKMPLLGICRGIQIMNVAAGGSVCQDIGRLISQPFKHNQQAPRWHVTHYITIKKNSTLFNILCAEKIRVNSFHHQMIGNLAPAYKVSAYSEDGVIEAIEVTDSDNFCVGVQFHPENLTREHPVFDRLFKAHAVASGRFMSIKTGAKIQENKQP